LAREREREGGPPRDPSMSDLYDTVKTGETALLSVLSRGGRRDGDT
jgi:hypothetical protein